MQVLRLADDNLVGGWKHNLRIFRRLDHLIKCGFFAIVLYHSILRGLVRLLLLRLLMSLIRCIIVSSAWCVRFDAPR